MAAQHKTSGALVRRDGSAAGAAVPTLYAPTPKAAKRFIEYFAPHIRNPNTRRDDEVAVDEVERILI
jgi:hypothetical protein